MHPDWRPKISETEADAQEEFKEEAVHARELQLVPGLTANDFDLDKLNEYISHLNRPVKVETIKAERTRGHAVVSWLALKLARELDRRVAPLGLTVDDAVERLKAYDWSA